MSKSAQLTERRNGTEWMFARLNAKFQKLYSLCWKYSDTVTTRSCWCLPQRPYYFEKKYSSNLISLPETSEKMQIFILTLLLLHKLHIPPCSMNWKLLHNTGPSSYSCPFSINVNVREGDLFVVVFKMLNLEAYHTSLPLTRDSYPFHFLHIRSGRLSQGDVVDQ